MATMATKTKGDIDGTSEQVLGMLAPPADAPGTQSLSLATLPRRPSYN